MIPSCHRHRFDESEDECRECGFSYCGNCLVYVHGATARPLCIQCALQKSGVRGSRRSHPSWRERRAHAKARKHAERAAADRAVALEAAANDVDDPAEAAQPSWVSLDASRWDIGAI